MRLRDPIEARAARKFSDLELEGNPPARSCAMDFREAVKQWVGIKRFEISP